MISNKIKSAEQLLSELIRIQSVSKGKTASSVMTGTHKRIVFTNGCFDILHSGHVLYLEAAKAEGDILVVGVNSDASIKRLKGNNRPIVPQQDRMIVLAALEAVDYVVLFDEDTPLELIRMISPDVLVKGGDWAPADIVGSDIVIHRGGNVKSLIFIENISTSDIIEKILRSHQTDRNNGRPNPL